MGGGGGEGVWGKMCTHISTAQIHISAYISTSYTHISTAHNSIPGAFMALEVHSIRSHHAGVRILSGTASDGEGDGDGLVVVVWVGGVGVVV